MMRSSSPLLSELRSPSSSTAQVTALRALKNEIIGHDQKKEIWIGLGVVTPLARILSSHRSGSKRRQRENNGMHEEHDRREKRSVEEETRLQAIILIGSFAQGGPCFIPPLSIGGVFPPLLSHLNPSESPPSTILAVLRTLNAVADSLSLEHLLAEGRDEGALKALFTDQNLSYLAQILDQNSPAVIIQQQISLAAALISKTCNDEPRRKQLAASKVLDSLSTRLASFMLAASGAHVTTGTNGPPGNDLAPAPATARLAPILQAIGTIIAGSKRRAIEFLGSAALAVDHEAWPPGHPRSGGSQLHQPETSAIAPPLPKDVPSQTSNFPPLGGLATWGKDRQSKGISSAMDTYSIDPLSACEDEDHLASWLGQVIQVEDGITRVMAAWILALLFRSGLTNKRRDRLLSMQLIPVLVRMLDSDTNIPSEHKHSYDNSLLQRPDCVILQQAPRVLALLVADNEDLQHSASEAGVFKKLSQLLKQSYDPLSQNGSSPAWSPSLEAAANRKRDTSGGLMIGEPGISPEVYHVLQMRESVISALAAMATFKDDFRKSIIDQGVVPFIVMSLKPEAKASEGVPNSGTGSATNTKNIGNPTPVLLAACEAATALSRSVSTLRTSLIDAGLAGPIFNLLRHPDIQVQIAATGAVCNIVLEFSPMRQDIIEAGVLEVLCDHAHSVNAKLRLNSLWALKHLVHSAPNALKINCLEELGPGWLKQIICNDIEDPGQLGSRSEGVNTSLSMGTPNAAGEQVDLLNSVDDRSHSQLRRFDEDEDDDEINMIDSIGALSRQDLRGSRQRRAFAQTNSKRPNQPDRRVSGVPNEEDDLVAQARRDDVAIQEQGLDFIRNLISGFGATEIIDYVFRELGQEKLFDILATLLRPKTVDAFSRDRRSSSGGIKLIPPHTEIIVAVGFIIVHLAAGLPRHRQLLVSQSELLRLLIPLFSHSHCDVRVSCAWIIINLTWSDDQADRMNARNRAFDLKKLGLYERLEVLREDPILDVRERAKQALHQMAELLRS